MMNHKLKKTRKSLKLTKNSPVMFEDEDMCTSSPDDVRSVKSAKSSRKSLTGHSTPIRNKIKTDCSDSPELNYNESPIEPLTQHPPNEVGWDYQRTASKEEESHNLASMEIIKTPKRNAALLSKKRNSNSPLLYNPLKKKLIQEQQQESMAGFMAELQEIAGKAKKIGEKKVETTDDNDLESQLIIPMDSEPSGDSDLKLQVSANTDESPAKNKVIVIKKEELLDDSMIEDMLVLCSQVVEAKEFGTNGQNMHSSGSGLESSSNKSSSFNSGKTIKSTLKEKSNSSNNNKTVMNSCNKNSPLSKEESKSLEIPDDSFDDFVVEFNDNDFNENMKTDIIINNVNTSTKAYTNKSCSKSVTSTVTTSSKNLSANNKFFSTKSTNCTNQTKSVSKTSATYSEIMTNAAIQNKVANAKANFGYLNQDYKKNFNSSNSSGVTSQIETNNSNSRNNDTRLFKAKSFSDSSFLDQNGSENNFNKTSRSYSAMESEKNDKHVVKTSTEHSSNWRRVHSSSSLSVQNSNNSQLNINRMSNSEGSLPLSTPAEIERKRQEAIMKREARLKMRLNNAAIKRPIQR